MIRALVIGIGALAAVAAAVGWFIVGGFPRDHDRYGAVAIPGRATLELPEGDVRLNFENESYRSGDDNYLEDQPKGLTVRVVSADGGGEVEVDDVPSWVFGSISNDRGHEPWGKVDVPHGGGYVVEATADGQPRFGSTALAHAPAADDKGPEITVGAAPWTPFGSRLIGALLAGVAVLAGTVLLSLPFLLMRR